MKHSQKIFYVGWGMELLFSVFLFTTKRSGVIFSGNIGWVPIFALVFGGVVFIYAFVRYIKARNVEEDAEGTLVFFNGCLASLLMGVAGACAL